jgi:hypothetical protein
MRSRIPPPRKVKSKPRPKQLSSSELLRYSQERRTLVVQLHEAAREVSALLHEMSLLLASYGRENRYNESSLLREPWMLD